jgi:hypothetical protein
MATYSEQLFFAQSPHILHIMVRASLLAEDAIGATFTIIDKGGDCVQILRHDCYGSVAGKDVRKEMGRVEEC